MKSKLLIALAASLLSGCAGFWNDLRGTPVDTGARATLAEMPAFPRNCLTGDRELAARSQCLAEDAACYQLDTGNWCTGLRERRCPRGSVPLELNAECPPGAECWIHSTSLSCRSV